MLFFFFFFPFSASYLSFLCRILLLCSEEAGYLPDRAEVIVVLLRNEGVLGWGLGRGSSTNLQELQAVSRAVI